MLREAKNLWIAFLPLCIFISFFLRDAPRLEGVNSNNSSTHPIDKNNFFAIEENLSALYVTKNNGLIIDATTEKSLSKISGQTNNYLDNSMLEKSFPSSQGKQLLQLVSCYRLYKKEEQRINKPYLSLQADQLIDYRNLQYEFFGELAQDLFSDHHAFYKSAEASGIKLISPASSQITVPTVCSRINNVE